ncbi:MAG TPA: preprotein translocase subunit SecA [Fimbriimonadaceae bacterium]|nr:preprotein translocase subunit SecA [Fimbriimonadaceae bacterium]
MQFLRKLFDTSKRDVENVQPIVDQINALEADISAMSDDELRAKGHEFKHRLTGGESLEAILPEVFAVVREASKRLIKMRQFDVQLVGGVVLHQGRIAEMKTGEGKTLVAVAPMVLNALTGRGAHLVTVNDYLARRDAVWMGPVYHHLGLTVGIIQGQSQDSDELGGSFRYVPGATHDDPRYLNLEPCSRREAYLCDIVYGTNHEFGFDYLRDNMAFSVEDLSMRELNFAIVDEVDSILIDEARTPHIISGPSMEDVSVYKEIDVIAKQLVGGGPDDKDTPGIHYTSDRKNHSCSLTEEGMDRVEELLGIDNIASDPRVFHHVNASIKAYGIFQRDIDYIVQRGEVVIIDENTGRPMYGRRFSEGLHQALEAKEGVPVQRESQTVAVITFQNLFRLYNKLAGMTGTAKTEEDEFRKIYGLDVVTVPTHRPNVRTDHADIVYKTEEAKMRGIANEILRLATKQQPVLVGTRSIEQSEKVSARLTPDMLQKLVLVWRLREMAEVKKEVPRDLKNDVMDLVNTPLSEIQNTTLSAVMNKLNLSGDPFHDDHLTWALKEWKLGDECKDKLLDNLKHGPPHNVLNAKFHEREALIIAEAGRKGQITIATNMAGRGVDILLGGRIADELVERARGLSDEADAEGATEATKSYRRGGTERAAPPLPLDDQERSVMAAEVRELGGLYILGTERHESRRIDNQLRGRAGRQGDPGESRFYVSLEDMLWRIFNANMLENPLLKAWPPMEPVDAKFLSGMIKKTQERIENHFFEARKHVLEYDDVLNAQREHIYGWRRDILLGEEISKELIGQIDGLIVDVVNDAWVLDENDKNVYDHSLLYEDLAELFPIVDYITPSDLAKYEPGPELIEYVQQVAHDAYKDKAERLGAEVMRMLETQVMLRSINDNWMNHLQTVEYIREGIGLRGYGQVDPLVAYKRETFDLFQNTLKAIRNQAVRMIYRAEVQVQPQEEPMQMARMDDDPALGMTDESSSAVSPVVSAGGYLGDVDWTRVGRNDPCPCGSGKKFKACHYPELRAQGVI